MERIAAESIDASDFREELERTLCACVGDLISTLKPEYDDVLRRVDLEGASLTNAADALEITPNNAGVRLHRARAALKNRLERSCGTCATHGCFDCTCKTCEKSA